MSTTHKRLRLASAVATVGLVLTTTAGCGDSALAEGGPRPGVAAEVNGEVLTLDELDSMIQEYCTLWGEYDDATPVAKSTVREAIVHNWVHSVGVEELADEAGIPTDERSDRELEEGWAALGEITDDNRDPLAEWTRIQDLLGEPLLTLGAEQLAEESDTPPSGEAAQTRGLELVADWLAEQDVVLNPAFGSVEDGEVVIGDDALSVPVSDFASTAALEDAGLEHLNALPAVQRCGPQSEPEPEPVRLPVR